MRLIALMLVRNEDWVIRLSLDTVFKWCDGVAILLDRCTDKTLETVDGMCRIRGKPAIIHRVDDGDNWNEMDLRQMNLEDGRKMKATHFAIVDADEVVTANYAAMCRLWMEKLKPGQVLDVPMVPVWDDLDHHRVDDPTWSKAWLTLGFADKPDMCWAAAADGYHHHARPPRGMTERIRRGTSGTGGVMHLQFANPRRLLAKHVLYRMVDHLRWPGRESVEQLNWKYDQALKPAGRLEKIPKDWWVGHIKEWVFMDDIPYQEKEIRYLLAAHGREKFAGLDLKGF